MPKIGVYYATKVANTRKKRPRYTTDLRYENDCNTPDEDVEYRQINPASPVPRFREFSGSTLVPTRHDSESVLFIDTSKNLRLGR